MNTDLPRAFRQAVRQTAREIVRAAACHRPAAVVSASRWARAPSGAVFRRGADGRQGSAERDRSQSGASPARVRNSARGGRDASGEQRVAGRCPGGAIGFGGASPQIICRPCPYERTNCGPAPAETPATRSRGARFMRTPNKLLRREEGAPPDRRPPPPRIPRLRPPRHPTLRRRRRGLPLGAGTAALPLGRGSLPRRRAPIAGTTKTLPISQEAPRPGPLEGCGTDRVGGESGGDRDGSGLCKQARRRWRLPQRPRSRRTRSATSGSVRRGKDRGLAMRSCRRTDTARPKRLRCHPEGAPKKRAHRPPHGPRLPDAGQGGGHFPPADWSDEPTEDRHSRGPSFSRSDAGSPVRRQKPGGRATPHPAARTRAVTLAGPRSARPTGRGGRSCGLPPDTLVHAGFPPGDTRGDRR